MRLLADVKDVPMWRPVDTAATVDEAVQAASMPMDRRSDSRLRLAFSLYAGITAVAGYSIGESSIGIVRATGLSATAFGTLVTAVANSLPELVTAIAAVASAP